MAISLRPAEIRDAVAIAGLRNHFVKTSTAIYTERTWSDEQALAWVTGRDASLHPLIVAIDDDDDRVVGYASLGPFDEKCGYATTVENSLYIEESHHRRGIGSRLLGNLLTAAEVAGHRTVIARIDAGSEASLTLHEKFGFTRAGILRQAGFKFGRWLDVVYMQKMLACD